MSAEELTARGRRAAEALMVDTVRVTRASGRPVTDPETGVVSVPSVVIHEGPGRVQARPVEARVVDGGINGVQTYVLSALTVQLPASVSPIVDDEVEVLASPVDPLLVGRTFRVDAAARKTHATMTRCDVTEVAA